MKPEETRNGVLLGGIVIPAVNVQVENVPGYLAHSDGTKYWYGVYFEILFENGSLWIVDQGSEMSDGEAWDALVSVLEYPHWGMTGRDQPGVNVTVDDWEGFLNLYNEKREVQHC